MTTPLQFGNIEFPLQFGDSMNITGIMLANGQNDLPRVHAVGFDHYLALEYQSLCLSMCNGEKYLRLDERGLYNNMDALAVKCNQANYEHIIPWNEQNLPSEGHFSEAYLQSQASMRMVYTKIAANYIYLRNRVNKILHFPAFSPNYYYRECVDAWCAAAEYAPVIDVHCYGTVEQMLEIVDWYRATFPRHELLITEWNFGAGNKVDPKQYAQDGLRFIREVAQRPEVIAAIGFIWKWIHPDVSLITTVDWEGQPIETAFKAFVKPERKHMSYTIIPSPNFGYPTGTHGRGGNTVKSIVVHIAQGSRAGLISTFSSPASQRSSNYTVCKSGEIIQWVPGSDAAYANGVDFSKGINAYKPDITVEWLAECWRNKVNPNLVTLSIELEGKTGEVLPEAQYNGLVSLCKQLMEKYGKLDIVGHCQIDSVNKPNCPGKGVDFQRLRSDVGGTVETYNKEIVLKHLDILWAAAGEADKRADELFALANRERESANWIRERTVALKRDLHLE